MTRGNLVVRARIKFQGVAVTLMTWISFAFPEDFFFSVTLSEFLTQCFKWDQDRLLPNPYPLTIHDRLPFSFLVTKLCTETA